MMGATGGVCSIEECGRPAHARGWCIGHYQRWRTKGDPGGPLREHASPYARFLAKINQQGAVPEHRPDLGPCWVWTGTLTKPGGYGRFWPSGDQPVLAHRYAYEAYVGPIPDGLQLDHLCRVKQCVRPSHLEPVTNAENQRRAIAIRTHCPNGHPYPEGETRCDICRRATQNRYDRRVRAEARKERDMTSVSPPP